jgi:membrane-associated protein
VTSYFLHLAPVLVYTGLALLVAGESAGVPLPGETSLVAAAVLASAHRLSLLLVVGIAAAAAIAGDNVGYLIGRRGVRSLLLRGGLLANRRRLALERAERFFARRGRTAVFFGRWLPWLRVTVAWLAGAGRMRWRTFIVWNALGGLAWATTIGVAVYLVGSAAQKDVTLVGIILLCVTVIGAAVALAVRFLRRESGENQAPAADSPAAIDGSKLGSAGSAAALRRASPSVAPRARTRP